MYLRQQSFYITAVASWCEKSALSLVDTIFMTLYIWNLIPGINSTMSALSNEYLLIAIGRSITELWPVKVRRRLHCEKYKSPINTNCVRAHARLCVCVWTRAWPRLVDDSFVWKHVGRDKTWEIRWQLTYRHILLCESLHTDTTL